MSESVPFFEVLKRARKRKDMTIQKLARRSGVSGGYICEMERGIMVSPSDAVVSRLARALEIDARDLLLNLHLRQTSPDVRSRFEDLRKLTMRLREEKEILERRLSDAAHILSKSKSKSTVLQEALEKLHSAVAEPSPRPGRPRKETSRALKTMLEKVRHAESAEPNARLQRVPIISQAPAGDPAAFTDGDYPPGFADAYENVPATGDPSAFGLRIVGDSMVPRFNPGDFVIVSPNRSVEEGRPVIAKVRGSDVTCKIYRRKGNLIVLAPCNPEYDLQIYEEKDIDWIYPIVKVIRDSAL